MAADFEKLKEWIGTKESDHASAPLKFVSSRNVRPMFVNRAITICGEPSADGRSAKLWAEDDTGALALNAIAEFV